MTETHVTRKEEQSVQTSRSPQTDATYIPDVDISETEDCIRLVADMPGVDPSSVDVSVEHHVLTIEGTAHVDAPEGCNLVGQEYGIGKYRRDFTLADTVDTTNIRARVKNGVLELTLPKRDEVKTRKIKIEG